MCLKNEIHIARREARKIDTYLSVDGDKTLGVVIA
jgi:hypothetical protein